MAKARRRIQKTVRMLPSVAAILHEVAVEDSSYRFLNEAEVLEAATELGALILAGQLYHGGRTLDTISLADVIGELRTRLIPMWDLLAVHDALPATVFRPGMQVVSAHEPQATQSSPVGGAALIDPGAAGMVQRLGGGFLDDDDD